MIKTLNICLKDVKKLSTLILYLPFLSIIPQANAEDRTWSRIGPEGAIINQLVINPSQANTLYAATQSSSFYSSSNEYILKSLNGGDSWVTLPWQGKALSTNAILAKRTHQKYSAYFYTPPSQGRTLAVDANNANIAFTSLSGFLLKTSDSGMNWRPVGRDIDLDSSSFFLMNTQGNPSFNALTSPNNEIANSEDGGEHWQLSKQSMNTTVQQTIAPSSRFPEGESTIQLLNAAPDNNTVLYGYTTLRHRSALAAAPALLYKSIDKGENWLNITPAGYQYLGAQLVFDPDNSDILFSIFAKSEDDSFANTVGEDLVMRSEDGGTSWLALSTPATDTTNYDVLQVYLDPSDKNTLYANIKAVTENSFEATKAIAKSIDLGKSWEIIDTSPFIPGSIVIDPVNNNKLLMAGKQGILRSDDGGQNWALSNTGIQHIGGKLSVANDNRLVMYLAANDLSSVIDRRDATGFYYKSIDGGQQWNTFNTSAIVTGFCHEFKINPQDNQDIFCLSDANIYQSLDGGEQWALLKKSASRQLIRAQDGLSIYLSDSTGTSKSEDNGKSWEVISNINEGKLSVHPQNQAILYYVLDDQLYSSTDSGANWQTLETPDNIAFNHLVIHPLNPEVMALYGTYAYLSTQDGGNSWRIVLETFNNGDTQVNSFPAEFNFISQLVLHPTDLNSIFIKTNTGIYASSDSGLHWQLRNSGIESNITNSYTGVNLLTSSTDVFVDTASGIFKLSDKVNFTTLSDCIFSWVEQESPGLFAPSSPGAGLWNGYIFRYYRETNSFLGILHQQEIHQFQPDVSVNIIPQGSIASYQSQSGCAGDTAQN
ncbi:VPS10 domain-containing protein [Methyloprofundus sp.]|uniref:sialidase family protein n=1 Tax=Methyloprofundus sp. TaxID=2020875 RepID=UPI003D0B1480